MSVFEPESVDVTKNRIVNSGSEAVHDVVTREDESLPNNFLALRASSTFLCFQCSSGNAVLCNRRTRIYRIAWNVASKPASRLPANGLSVLCVG